MFSRQGFFARKIGRPGKAVLVGLVLVLVAEVAGPSVRYEQPGYDDAQLMAQARAKAPQQHQGSAADHGADPTGPPNLANPVSLQSKYPALAGGEVKARANDVKVENVPNHVQGFDEKTSKELPDRRTATERTYANADGTYTTEFSREAENYRTPSGAYQPIDTSIVPREDGTGWRNAGDNVTLGFAKTANAASIVDVKIDDQHQFGFGLAETAGVPGAVDGSRIVYPAVRPGADLRLDVLPGGVKETLVLNSPQAPGVWEFPLRLTGLRPSIVDGRVALLDASGAERAQIPAGFMADAKRDPETGELTTSQGVTYKLIERSGQTVLRVELDTKWLNDPARQYPVEVDPSVETTVSNGGTVFQSGGKVDGGTDLKVGTNGSIKAASYLSFGGVENRLRNHKILGAQLTLKNHWSWSCQPRALTVHGVVAPWTSASAYPGPAFGAALTRESFAHGYIGLYQHASSCPSTTELIQLGEGGRDLVQRWVTGASPNYGLTVRASDTDRTAWKMFTGHRTANPPRLFVTYTAYDAEYRVDRGVPEPPVTRLQGGKVVITVTNRGANTWTAADFALGYRAYTTEGHPVASVEAASLPHDVPRGESVTLEAEIKQLDVGDYLLDFSMLRRGGPWFTDEQIPPTRLVMTVFDVPPIVKAQYPPNGFSAPTLTPQLWVDAVDVDAPVNSSLKYRFEVCLNYVQQPDGTLTGVSCVDSGYVDKRTWTVPPGALRWSKDYQWRAFAFDGNAESQKLSPSHLLTAVPQPEITSHLATAPYNGAQRDFDPQTGNYFSSAIDASLVVTGPELSIARTYNSLDPRRDLLFGAGWSTRYDMRVVPDNDGSGNVVVTYPDGQEVRFGRNSDATFSAPPGRQANFRTEVEGQGGGWVLTDRADTLYRFRPDGRLIAIHDASGHYIELDYGTPEHLRRAISRTSDRILYFKWTGNHITSVSTDPIDGKQLTWNYTYDGDRLTKVCDPYGGCTKYEHTAGSHYRSAVVDSRPSSYWRFGETGGTVAASQVGVNLGKDNGAFKDVTLGQPSPLTNGADTAASFNGTSSVVTLPDGMVRKNRDLAIEMWFNTKLGGPLFGYQKSPIGETPEGAVPVLYVGTDGKLRGQFWNGTAAPITSAAAVNNGEWHHVVLSGSLATQTLYLDGQKVGSVEGEITHDDIVYSQLGAAYTVPPSAWPAWGNEPRRFFAGQIDEVAYYEYPVGPTAVAAHFQAKAGADYLTKISLPSDRVAAQLAYNTTADRLVELTDRDGGRWKLATPVVTGAANNLVRTTQVTDPGNRLHFYDYDPMRGRILRYIAPLGQGLRQEDRRDPAGNPVPPPPSPCDPSNPPPPGDPSFCGGPTTGGAPWVGGPAYGQGVRAFDYDDQGFQTTITDEIGDLVVLTNDERGNVIARKTCRVAPGNCQTSYYSYYLNPGDVTDPRNDKLVSSRDARSANASDSKYATTYTYTGVGVRGLVETVKTPDGAVTKYAYTDGNDAAIGGGNAPAGLIRQVEDPRGGVTKYSYFRNGDLAQVIDAAKLITNFTYDVFGRRIAQTQVSDSFPGGVTTTFGFDALSRQTAMTSPAVVNPLTQVKHTGQVLQGYDADGNLTRIEAKDTTGGDPSRVTAIAYDEFGHANQVTDAEGASTHFGYDGFGNVTWRVDAGGNKYEFGYTGRNALAEVRLRAFHGNAVDPVTDGGDTDGGGDTSSAPTLVLASYGYDLAGKRIRQTDAMGRTTRFQHFGDGKIWKVVAEKVSDPFNPNAPKRDITLHEFAYDAAGNRVQDTRPNGQVTGYEFDAAGRAVVENDDPAGLANRTEWTYAQGGDIKKVTRSGKSSNSTRLDVGRIETTEYEYDTAGRQTSNSVVNNASEKFTTTYGYDQRGLVTSVTEPRGNVAGADRALFTTESRYDELGLPITVTGPLTAAETGGNQAAQVRPQTMTGYSTFGEPTNVREPNGNLSTTAFDRLGRVTELTSPEYRAPGDTTGKKAVAKLAYDGLGNVIASTNPLGAITRSRYDQLGRLVERIDPRPDAGDQPGGVWSYSYTKASEPLSVTDPTGSRREATYDDLGRQVTSTKLERRPEPAAYTTQLRYDDASNLVSATSPTGDRTRFDYDPLGRPTSVTDPAGVVEQRGYDSSGNQVRASDGLGRTKYLTFDGAGRNTSVIDLDAGEHILRKRSATYDAVGNKISEADAFNHTTKFGYDNRSLLVRQEEQTTDVAADAIVTTFGYDAAGNRTRVTDGRQNATVRTYNSLGLVESVIEAATTAHPLPADSTWTNTYNLVGQVTKSVAPGGVTRQREFDALGRLKLETGTGAAQPTADRKFRFDAAGRVLGLDTPGGEKTFTYNDRGALLTSTAPSAGTSSYTYDGVGRLTERTDKAGTAKFSYTQGRLSSQTDGLTGVAQAVGYDGAGAVSQVDYGSGRKRTYSYDDFGRLSGDDLKGSDGASLSSVTYGYDVEDRLTSKKTSAGDNTYGYDFADRLTSWTSAGKTVDYKWDASGNRVKAGAKTATFDQRNRQLTDGADTLAWSPRGTLDSRTTASGTVTSAFDAFDRAVKQGSATYGYDSLDRASDRNGRAMSYDGMSLDLISDGVSSFSRGLDGGLLSQVNDSGVAQIALTDRHSDVVGGLHPSSSSLVGSSTFDPFGQRTGGSGAASPLGYQSDYTDPETGGVDMGARWYAPGTGTFTARDNVALPTKPSVAANRYTYGFGQPTNLADPDGHCPACVVAAPLAGAGPPGWLAGGLIILGGLAITYIGTHAIDTLREDAKNKSRGGAGGGFAAPPLPGAFPDGWNEANQLRIAAQQKARREAEQQAGGGPRTPPPPPPGIAARQVARVKALRIADPTPAAAVRPLVVTPVSSSPELPAILVSSQMNDVQDINTVYDWAKSSVLDPGDPVIENVAKTPVSELEVDNPVGGERAAAPDAVDALRGGGNYEHESPASVQRGGPPDQSAVAAGRGHVPGVDIVGTNHNVLRPTQDYVDPDTVEYYVEELRAGRPVGPIETQRLADGREYIEEGHHRYVASVKTGIPVERITVDGATVGMPDWSGVGYEPFNGDW
ncbi:LamG-like jellyroll fold domain-containing protein [Amycolatopsis sp. NPDC059657]|uniref:LamG-like jellyroll fold domain-containing protein n=1 Tax=Amycolatopsis sp. NPDC059657 TaxID=3346899 RepID=UPI00366CB9D9